MKIRRPQMHAVYKYGISVAFSLTVSLAGIRIAGAQERCEWSKISKEASIGANEVVVFSNVRTVRQVAGWVMNPNGDPIPTAIVDVYKYKGSSVSETDRIRSYHVNEHGYFCLGDLPDGKFTLRFGTEVFAFKHMIIPVRKSKAGSRKPIEVRLDVGT